MVYFSGAEGSDAYNKAREEPAESAQHFGSSLGPLVAPGASLLQAINIGDLK